MAKHPGTIRRRGRGWQVILRLRGERHEFGPRSDPLLRTDVPLSVVEQWARAKHAQLAAAAEREALRESLARLEPNDG